MKIQFLKGDFAVCKLRDTSQLDLSQDLFFFAKTKDELSLVCADESVPANTLKTDRGWTMFVVEGELDFALVGIIAEISRVLAEKKISLFVVSTYNTDYVMVKKVKAEEAEEALREAGYEVG